MDTGTLAIVATAVGGLIGLATATLTSWMNQREARLQGQRQHDNEMSRWRAERLASAYEQLAGWMTVVFHAVEDLQLKQTWTDTPSEGAERDFGVALKSWVQGPLRVPSSVAATRVSWSYAIRQSVVNLEQQIELYIAQAFEHDADSEDWLEAMYGGKDEILYTIERTLIEMREELYGPDATAPRHDVPAQKAEPRAALP